MLKLIETSAADLIEFSVVCEKWLPGQELFVTHLANYANHVGKEQSKKNHNWDISNPSELESVASDNARPEAPRPRSDHTRSVTTAVGQGQPTPKKDYEDVDVPEHDAAKDVNRVVVLGAFIMTGVTSLLATLFWKLDWYEKIKWLSGFNQNERKKQGVQRKRVVPREKAM